jgi:hypothetical protein
VTQALCAALIPIDKNEKLHPADLLLNRMASMDSAKFKTPRIYTIFLKETYKIFLDDMTQDLEKVIKGTEDFQTDPDFLG